MCRVSSFEEILVDGLSLTVDDALVYVDAIIVLVCGRGRRGT
ncbi:hypothetical protein SS05631_b63770 (plasmid) [Sinorhizobium sp. CCBAU 05631]|nr:hypothetical protein SS05631_b63770 [Sinorhizobium sp. CCBAU 05631]